MSAKIFATVLAGCLFFLSAGLQPVLAGSNFSVLSEREEVYLNLENPEATLVLESRSIPLTRGVNEINFSWHNVQIDPDSLRLDFLEKEADARVVGTNYWDDNALTWEIYSDTSQQIEAGIYFLIDGFNRDISYRVTHEPEEDFFKLREERTIFNHSGEDFMNALLRLGHGYRVQRDFSAGETRRLPVYRSDKLPVNRYLLYDAQKQASSQRQRENELTPLPVNYEFYNTQEKGLGDKKLPAGKARLYEITDDRRQIFTGEDELGFTAPGDTFTLAAGLSRKVDIQRNTLESERENITRDIERNIQLYDLVETVELTAESFHGETRVVRLKDYIDGEWEMLDTSHSFERINHRTIQFEIELQPGEKEAITFRYRRKNIREDYR